MSSFIGVGKINRNIYILFLAVFFRLLSNSIYGFRYYENIKRDPIYIFDSLLKNHLTLQQGMKFFGITALSFVYYTYENQEINKVSKNKKSKYILIHNKASPNNIKCKYITQILLIGFLYGLLQPMLKLYFTLAPSDTDYWSFEFFFFGLFIKKIFKTDLYKHQIFSMFFILISGSIIKFLLFLYSYNKPLDLKLLFIPYYLLITLIRSYVYTKIKWLMEIRYISNSKILLILGSFGFFISLIICIFTSIFPSFISEKFVNYSSQLHTISPLEFITEIILIITYMCLKFFEEYYYMLTLKIFTPIHVLINNSLYFLFTRIILLLVLTITNTLQTSNGNNNYLYIFCSFLDFVFALFGYLVFVEFIELKCCGYNFDLKKNIISRSRLDLIEENNREERNELDDHDEITNSSELSN